MGNFLVVSGPQEICWSVRFMAWSECEAGHPDLHCRRIDGRLHLRLKLLQGNG